MREVPNSGLVLLVIAKLVCCVGLILVISGTLTLGTVATWFTDESVLWNLGVILSLGVFAGTLWLRAHRRAATTIRKEHMPKEFAP